MSERDETAAFITEGLEVFGLIFAISASFIFSFCWICRGKTLLNTVQVVVLDTKNKTEADNVKSEESVDIRCYYRMQWLFMPYFCIFRQQTV